MTVGVSAAIDGVLHIAVKIKGEAVVTQTACHMEFYKWKPEEGLIVKQSDKGARRIFIVSTPHVRNYSQYFYRLLKSPLLHGCRYGYMLFF